MTVEQPASETNSIWWQIALKNLRSAIIPGNQSNSGDPWWFTYIPLIAGTLAAIAGILTVKASYLANDAVYNSNQAVLAQSRASDSWAEYQANSIKARIVETAIIEHDAKSDIVKKLTSKDDEYRRNQPRLKAIAQNYEQQRDDRIGKSTKRLLDRDGLTYAGVTVQLGIAIASLAAMTKKDRVFHLTVTVTAISLAMTVYSLLKIYL